MITFKINSPFWMSAGKPEYLDWGTNDHVGVGVDREKLNNGKRGVHYKETLRIVDKKGRVYTCPVMVLWVFRSFYKTRWTLKGGKKLVVFPLYLFDEQ